MTYQEEELHGERNRIIYFNHILTQKVKREELKVQNSSNFGGGAGDESKTISKTNMR